MNVNSSKANGFTLIELLVVLSIIGVTVGAVAFAIGDGGHERELKEEVIKTQRWLIKTQQSAIVGSRILSLEAAGDNSLRQLQYRANKWQAETDNGNTFSIAGDIKLEIVTFHSEDLSDSFQQNRIVFFPDGEISPFEMQFEINEKEKLTLHNKDNHAVVILEVLE